MTLNEDRLNLNKQNKDMRRVYLLVYSNVIGDRDVMKGILNNIEGVLDWRFDMPNSFYVISEMNACTLVDRIHANIHSDSCRFFITEISANHQGYLPKDTWEFINSVRNA